MISFECDYNNGAHPQVLQRLVETNNEQTLTYGFDKYSESAKEKIRQACDSEYLNKNQNRPIGFC